MIQHALHLLFLSLFALCAVRFMLTPSTQGRSRLGYLFGGLFLCLLIHQAIWQIHGAGSAKFLHFRTHYDPRQNLAQGNLLDRHGQPITSTLATFHLLGYDKKGATTGLLRLYKSRLSGNLPLTFDQDNLLQRRPPQDITLTLDLDLQNAAYEALQGRPGAVVALDPRTGEILALVSSPSLSLADFEKGTPPSTNSPQFNRPTAGLYPPGSVFKIFTAALAIEHRQAQPRPCPVKGWSPASSTPRIRDTHTHRGDPPISISTAFAESSNIWFAKAAMDCGWENFNAAYQRLGFENAFTLAQADDLTLGTAAGKLPSLKKQRVASLAYPGFGQGDLLLSPLHIALLTATIANEGLLAYPHLEKDAPQPAPTRIWKTSTADNVKDLMAASVHHGTSKSVQIDGLSICGKTGTAEREGRPSHAWFTCFAPQDNPEIVLTVLVEHGGYGAATAIPIARDLLQRYFKKPNP